MTTPLAHQLRPNSLKELVGQNHLLESNAPFRRAMERNSLGSVIFWGPPGCGKTTLAELISNQSNRQSARISAVTDGMPALRKILKNEGGIFGQELVLFVDEIHRWNKAQQDALLPHVENGRIQLIGATTENPYFSIIPALRSRTWILELHALSDADLLKLITRGAKKLSLNMTDEQCNRVAAYSSGDARRALSLLERIHLLTEDKSANTDTIDAVLNRKDLLHDKDGSAHYDVVSAFIKSMRGSDPDAALYWLARLIAGGEDPVFIARRMVIFASEDIGNADLRALPLAVSTMQGVSMIGYPEARIILGHCCSYLASAPKSNASYMAIKKALGDIEMHGALSPPPNIRNHPQNYIYPHDFPLGIVNQGYWPLEMGPKTYYGPKSVGDEKIILQRLQWWKEKLKISGKKKKDD